jgi:hypothetical protein
MKDLPWFDQPPSDEQWRGLRGGDPPDSIAGYPSAVRRFALIVDGEQLRTSLDAVFEIGQ